MSRPDSAPRLKVLLQAVPKLYNYVRIFVYLVTAVGVGKANPRLLEKPGIGYSIAGTQQRLFSLLFKFLSRSDPRALWTRRGVPLSTDVLSAAHDGIRDDGPCLTCLHSVRQSVRDATGGFISRRGQCAFENAFD